LAVEDGIAAVARLITMGEGLDDGPNCHEEGEFTKVPDCKVSKVIVRAFGPPKCAF